MPDLPIMLRIRGHRCVIVGGGGVAYRRALALLQSGARVTVIAPDISDELMALPVTLEQRSYKRGDLSEAFLVVVASNDAAVNEAVAMDANADGVLTNRPDDPEAGDLLIPAYSHHGPITLAVSTSGISASAAATIRRDLAAHLDPSWATLLDLVAPFRAAILDRFDDPRQRQARLVQLTNPTAMALLKQYGPAAVLRHCRRLITTVDEPAATEPAAPPGLDDSQVGFDISSPPAPPPADNVGPARES